MNPMHAHIIRELLAEIEKCGFTCQAGPLENLVQYQELKQMVALEEGDDL